jgi:putative glycosyltransferase
MAGDDYEIVLVNDGSPDDSLARAIAISESDAHVVVVDLSRNFGHHRAMMTGLAYARGDVVFLIDSDLEEEPEWLALFARQMADDKCDVVYGVQQERRGGFWERWSGHLFYRLLRGLTGLPLPSNAITARLMSKRYVDALLRHTEREVFIDGLWHITGFDQRASLITKRRLSGTTYTFSRKMAHLVNSVTSFSNAPLIGIFYLGVAVSTLAGGYTAFLVIQWLFYEKPLVGWTSVMASMWLLGGLVISFIGVVGIYLSKIFSESKQRPLTIVRQVYGRHAD